MNKTFHTHMGMQHFTTDGVFINSKGIFSAFIKNAQWINTQA